MSSESSQVIDTEMNIVEAYIKFKGQLIILISGLSGSGRTELAKNIADTFKINIINQKDYYYKSHNETTTLPNNKTVVNWDSDKAYDWDKFNNDINNIKSKGVVVVGISFNKDLITFKPDYHFHLVISKQKLFEDREKLVEKNKEKCPKEYEEYKDGTAKLIFNQLTYPYYKQTTENSIINKFLNVNKMTQNELFDSAFDTLIEFINKKVYE